MAGTPFSSFSMSNIGLPDFGLVGGAVSDFGSASADLVTQQGFYKAAEQYTSAGNIEGQNVQIERASGAIQKSQAARALYKSVGATEGAAGGAGLKSGGSVSDVIHDSMAQGALQQAIIGANTEAKINDYTEQQDAFYAESSNATAQGNAAGAKSGSDMLGGIISGVAGIASMFL